MPYSGLKLSAWSLDILYIMLNLKLEFILTGFILLPYKLYGISKGIVD